MEFSQEESMILSKFFTNMDRNVFALRNLPEVVKGALFSRYSRTDKSLRRVLLDEFINKPEMGFNQIVNFSVGSGTDETVAIKKAEEFYDRVLVGFGDDSVAELGGAHIACEGVSNIATKVLEDPRLGLSPLEKSSRYVYFNDKADGKYRYYRGPDVMESVFADDYIEIMDLLFDTYSKLIEPMKKFITEKNPIEEGMTERAYGFTIRAKACDVLRVFLPAGTLTNVGIFGNGRAFEYLLTKMYAHDLQEMRDIAGQMQHELSGVIPSFVKRADDKYGRETQKFWIDSRNAVKDFILTLPQKSTVSEEVELAEYDREAEQKIAAAILYSQSAMPLRTAKALAAGMQHEQRRKIIGAYVAKRQNRRHRPGRAFEHAYYTFDILGNYGIYRDLQRHRVLTQERQDLTAMHGFDTPKEMEEAGCAGEYRECMRLAKAAFEKIEKRSPKQAQYVVPFGYKVRWYFHLNLRELYHLCELRTMRQGHPDYRRICQKMYLLAKEVHPSLVENMRFVDMNSYVLERSESEKKIDQKLAEMDKRYGKA